MSYFSAAEGTKSTWIKIKNSRRETELPTTGTLSGGILFKEDRHRQVARGRVREAPRPDSHICIALVLRASLHKGIPMQLLRMQPWQSSLTLNSSHTHKHPIQLLSEP